MKNGKQSCFFVVVGGSTSALIMSKTLLFCSVLFNLTRTFATHHERSFVPVFLRSLLITYLITLCLEKEVFVFGKKSLEKFWILNFGSKICTNPVISKTTALHVLRAFLYISLPSLHDYDVKMPYLVFYRGRQQSLTYFSFLSPRNKLQAPVVRKLHSAIHRINRYPEDKYYVDIQLRYPVDSAIHLSNNCGQGYSPTFDTSSK